ncbi:MAG: diguanylate cyclase [Gaiellaceae bacterium]
MALTIVLLVISAGLALAVAVLVVLLVIRRSSSTADQRVSIAVSDMNTRMESMLRELGQALERAEEQIRRTHTLSELGGSIDLDEVLARTLEAAGEIEGADASLVSVRGAADGKALVATLGLSVEESEREGMITGPPDGRATRSIAISYRYDQVQLVADGNLIHAGLAVPLRSEAEPLGQLAVFTRSAERAFAEGELDALEQLARRAGPAIANAALFREARQLADLDSLTGLHNRRYFHETLAREVARGHRYDRRLALIVFDLDDFKAINDRIGHLAGDAVLADAAERVREVVRSADIACRVGGDEFAVILPESGRAEADQLYRRIQGEVAKRPIALGGKLVFSAGVAELGPEDDAATFFQRADDALYRAKERGKGQIAAATSA